MEMKRCRVCDEEIRSKAKKCNHCNSYQSWTRSLGISQTILALLIALISVATSAFPLFQYAVTPDDSRLDFFLSNVRDEKFAVVVSNVGSRPGIVVAAAIYTGLDIDETYSRIVYLRNIDGMAATIVEPGKTSLIVFQLDPARYRRLRVPNMDLNLKPCNLKLSFQTFRGAPQTLEKSVGDCRQVRFIRNYEDLPPDIGTR